MAKRRNEQRYGLHIGGNDGSCPPRVFISHSHTDHIALVDEDAFDILKAPGGTSMSIPEIAKKLHTYRVGDVTLLVEGETERRYLAAVLKRMAASQITTPPGTRLTWLTQFCISAEAHRLFVRPAIADMQVEYADARKAKQPLRAMCILVRGYVSVLPCWLYGLIAQAVKRIFSM